MKAHSLPAYDSSPLLPRADILRILHPRLLKRPGDAYIGIENRHDCDGSAGFYPVKRLILAVALVFGWASATWAAGPSPLTDLRAMTALSNAEASHHLPVAFEATVSYFPDYESLLFVQDGDAGIFVLAPKNVHLAAGDRVLVRGRFARASAPLSFPTV